MPSLQIKIEQHRIYTFNFANHPRVILTSALSLLSCNEMYQEITPIFFYIYYFISIQISYGRFLAILSGSLRGKISCLPQIFCSSGMVALCAVPPHRTVSPNYRYHFHQGLFLQGRGKQKLCTNFHRKRTEMSTTYFEQKCYLSRSNSR